MENTQTRRRLSVTLPPSPPPRLLRSRSTSTTPATTPATTYAPPQNINNLCTPKSSPRLIKPRPKSTTFNKNEENINPSPITISSTQKKQQENNKWFSLQRGSSSPRTNIIGATKGARSVTNSPSAWALSPGRSLGCPARPESPGSGGKRAKGGGGVSGVLKYFKQKKVATVQEEEFHRFRVMHNRLLQWRFVNARAEAAMAGVKRVAEAKIFSVWIRILKMRKSILENRIQMQKLKLEIKLHQIINPQIILLNQWANKLEKRNQESVSRVARKLLGISVRLPLVQGAKADVVSIYQALSTAMGVMDSIEATITKFISKIETVLFLVTELRSTFEQEDEYMEELDMAIALVATLLAKEESVQVHLIQAAKESRRGQCH